MKVLLISPAIGETMRVNLISLIHILQHGYYRKKTLADERACQAGRPG